MSDIVFGSCNNDSFILLKMKDGVIIDRDENFNEFLKKWWDLNYIYINN